MNQVDSDFDLFDLNDLTNCLPIISCSQTEIKFEKNDIIKKRKEGKREEKNIKKKIAHY